MASNPATNTPNPASVRMAEEFPLLWDLAKDHDNAQKLGATSTRLSEEADRALRELWDARQAHLEPR